MIGRMNRMQAKENFLTLARGAGFSEVKEFKIFYPLKRDCQETLKWYAKETFFYKLLNKGLRKFKNPEDLFYLRLPFSDLFVSIK